MLTISTPQPTQKQIYQEAMVHSFRMMIYSSKAFMQFGEGHIVLLFGSSTAGKSSLCREFLDISPDWYHDSNDKSSERLLRHTLNNFALFKKTFPSRYQSLKVFFDDQQIASILKQGPNTLPCTDLLSTEQRQEIMTLLDDVSLIEELCSSMSNILIAQEDMFEKAMRESKQGVSVILDTLDFENFMHFKAKRNFHCPFQAVFVFCPLSVLDSRVESRNQRALTTNNIDDCRLGLFPFLTYSAFVQRSNGKHNPIDGFERQHLMHILEKHAGVERVHRSFEGIEHVQQRMLGTIFNELDIEENPSDYIEVSEKYPSDYLLDTSTNSPAEASELIGKRNKRRL